MKNMTVTELIVSLQGLARDGMADAEVTTGGLFPVVGAYPRDGRVMLALNARPVTEINLVDPRWDLLAKDGSDPIGMMSNGGL